GLRRRSLAGNAGAGRHVAQPVRPDQQELEPLGLRPLHRRPDGPRHAAEEHQPAPSTMAATAASHRRSRLSAPGRSTLRAPDPNATVTSSPPRASSTSTATTSRPLARPSASRAATRTSFRPSSPRALRVAHTSPTTVPRIIASLPAAGPSAAAGSRAPPLGRAGGSARGRRDRRRPGSPRRPACRPPPPTSAPACRDRPPPRRPRRRGPRRWRPGGDRRTPARRGHAGEPPAAWPARGAGPAGWPRPRRSRAPGSRGDLVPIDDPDDDVLVGHLGPDRQLAHAGAVGDDHPVARAGVQPVDGDDQARRLGPAGGLRPDEQQLASGEATGLARRPEPPHHPA